MVIVTTDNKPIEAEVITVNDLLGGSSSSGSVSSGGVPSGSPDGLDKIEQWIRLLDKGLSLADRGITLMSRADSIVKSISDVAKQKLQQQQPQQIIYHKPEEALPAEVVPAGADARPPAEESLPEGGPDAASGRQLITADRISGVLSLLLKQCPEMTVQQLKDLIDRNPDSINNMLSILK